MMTLRLLLIALFASPALASENIPSLVGTWRSDGEATNAYLEKHAKLTELQKKAFAAFFGKSVVTFRADGSGTIFLPARTMPKKDGGQLNLAATEFDFTFKVLDSADSQIVIKSDVGKELIDGYPFAILKFHGPDTYSVSLSDGLGEINGREFFKRSKTPISEQTGAGQPATRPVVEPEGGEKPQPEAEGRRP